MEQVEQITRVNDFLEEQTWYIQSLAKEKNINLGVVRSLRETNEESLKAAYWLIQDMIAVMKGEL
jgi:hypothetical protein